MFTKQTKQNFYNTHETITQCNNDLLKVYDNVKELDKMGYNVNTKQYFDKLKDIQKLLNELKVINNDEYNKIFK